MDRPVGKGFSWVSAQGETDNSAFAMYVGKVEYVILFILCVWGVGVACVGHVSVLSSSAIPVPTGSAFLEEVASLRVGMLDVTSVCITCLGLSLFSDCVRLWYAQSGAESRTTLYLTLINGIALFTYVASMRVFADPTQVQHVYWKVEEEGIVVNVYRMIGWIPSTSLITLLVGLLAFVKSHALLSLVLAQACTVATGFWASLLPYTHSGFWVLTTLSFASFAYVVLSFRALETSVQLNLSGPTAKRDMQIGAMAIRTANIMWMTYPIIWIAHRSKYLSNLDAERWFSVTDVLVKCLLTTFLSITTFASIVRRGKVHAMRARITRDLSSASHLSFPGETLAAHLPVHASSAHASAHASALSGAASAPPDHNSNITHPSTALLSALRKGRSVLLSSIQWVFALRRVAFPPESPVTALIEETQSSLLGPAAVHDVYHVGINWEEPSPFSVYDVFDSTAIRMAGAVEKSAIEFIAIIDDTCRVNLLATSSLLEYLTVALINTILEGGDCTALVLNVKVDVDLDPESVPEGAKERSRDPSLPWVSLIISASVSSPGLRETDLFEILNRMQDEDTRIGKCNLLCNSVFGTLGIRSSFREGVVFSASVPVQKEVSISPGSHPDTGKEDVSLSSSAIHTSDLDALGAYDVLVIHPDPLICRSICQILDSSNGALSWTTLRAEANDIITPSFVSKAFSVAKLVLVDESMADLIVGLKAVSSPSPVDVRFVVLGTELEIGKSHTRVAKPLHVQQLRRVLAGMVESESFKWTFHPLPTEAEETDVAATSDESASVSVSVSNSGTPSSDVDFSSVSIAPWMSDHALVVDDAKMNILIARAALKRLGFTNIDTAEDGVKSLEFVRQAILYDYDIPFILMDTHMPLMNGHQATRAIRELEAETPGRRRTPIIALTTDNSDINKTACRTAGMDYFVHKPFKMSDLLDVISVIVHPDPDTIPIEMFYRSQRLAFLPPIPTSTKSTRSSTTTKQVRIDAPSSSQPQTTTDAADEINTP